MLKHNNNKRTITVVIGIIVAILVILTSFGPTMAEGISKTTAGFLPKLQWPDINFQKLVKIIYHR